MGALVEAGVEPERFFAEYAPHQFEIPVAASRGPRERRPRGRAAGGRARDRPPAGHARELRAAARPRSRRATACTSTSACSTATATPLLYDAARPACLSELGGRFAAGILRHARALSALTAPSPVSGARLQPHRWSAGAVCLAAAQPRGAAAHPARGRARRTPTPPASCTSSTAAPTPAANPYLALGAILRAGLEGVRDAAARAAAARPRPRRARQRAGRALRRGRAAGDARASRCRRSPRTPPCAAG